MESNPYWTFELFWHLDLQHFEVHSRTMKHDYKASKYHDLQVIFSSIFCNKNIFTSIFFKFCFVICEFSVFIQYGSVYLTILNLLSTWNYALNIVCALNIMHYVCFDLHLVNILQGAYTNVAIGKIKFTLCS